MYYVSAILTKLKQQCLLECSSLYRLSEQILSDMYASFSVFLIILLTEIVEKHYLMFETTVFNGYSIVTVEK